MRLGRPTRWWPRSGAFLSRHEFRGAPKRSRLLLAIMFLLYLAGLVLLTLSFRTGAG